MQGSCVTAIVLPCLETWGNEMWELDLYTDHCACPECKLCLSTGRNTLGEYRSG